jgi:hypothetical protein
MLGWASTICCLILLASMLLFVVNQTSAASRAQVQELGNAQPAANNSSAPASSNLLAAQGTNAAARSGTTPANEGTGKRLIEEAAETLRSPFSGVASSSSSEWATRGLTTLLALIFYGAVLGFFARAIQIRVRAMA